MVQQSSCPAINLGFSNSCLPPAKDSGQAGWHCHGLTPGVHKLFATGFERKFICHWVTLWRNQLLLINYKGYPQLPSRLSQWDESHLYHPGSSYKTIILSYYQHAG